MTLIEHDRRRGFHTRFAELFACGPVAMLYGWEALHVHDAAFVKSQFQILLELQGNPHLAGFWLFIFGLACTTLSMSVYKWIRLGVHAALVLGWLGICAIFLTYKQPGLPLGIGGIFALTSIIVCCTIVWHEAQQAARPVSL